jgi:hypothetical protein
VHCCSGRSDSPQRRNSNMLLQFSPAMS